jgi:hypothetical protein
MAVSYRPSAASLARSPALRRVVPYSIETSRQDARLRTAETVDSKILYTRYGNPRTAYIATRRVPNMLAVKFAVIAQEIEEGDALPSMQGDHFLDALLKSMGVVIVDVVAVRKSVTKKDLS